MLSVSDLGQLYSGQHNNPTALYDNSLVLDVHSRCRMQTYELSYVCWQHKLIASLLLLLLTYSTLKLFSVFF